MATAPKFTPDPRIARLMARSDAMLGMALQPRKNPLPQNPYYIPGMAGMVGQLGSGLMSRRARTRGEDIENRQKMAQQMLGAALDPYAEIYKGLKGLGTGEVGVVAGTNPFDILSYKKSLAPKVIRVVNQDTNTIRAFNEATGELLWEKEWDDKLTPAPWFIKDTESKPTYRVDPKILDSLGLTTNLGRWAMRTITRGVAGVGVGDPFFGLGKNYIDAKNN